MQTLDIEAHFQASHGYAQLGMLEEAHAELDALLDVPESAVPVSSCRIALYTHEGRWHDAGLCAFNLCELEPHVLDHFLIAAAIQRELGLYGSAIDVLLEGPLSLVGLPEYHYNLACYFALLGASESALDSLHHAIDLDETYRKRLWLEPDLRSIRHLLPPPESKWDFDLEPEPELRTQPAAPPLFPDCPF